MDWTSDDVLARLVEAVDVIEGTASRGPRLSTTNGWPAYLHDHADLRDWADEWRKGVWDRWARARKFSADQIARADDAFDWLAAMPDDVRRKTVLSYAFCQAKGRPIGPVLKKNAWKRSTFYDRLEKALQRIAVNLSLRDILRVQAADDYVAQIARKRGIGKSTVARGASHWSDEGARPEIDNFGTDPDPSAWAAEQSRRRRRDRVAEEIDR